VIATVPPASPFRLLATHSIVVAVVVASGGLLVMRETFTPPAFVARTTTDSLAAAPAWCGLTSNGSVASHTEVRLHVLGLELGPEQQRRYIEIECRAAELVRLTCGHEAALRGARFVGEIGEHGEVAVRLDRPLPPARLAETARSRCAEPRATVVVTFAGGAPPRLRASDDVAALCPAIARD
jgi:hypothetical protein